MTLSTAAGSTGPVAETFRFLPYSDDVKRLNDDPAHQAIVDSFHAKWRVERAAAIARRMRKEVNR